MLCSINQCCYAIGIEMQIQILICWRMALFSLALGSLLVLIVSNIFMAYIGSYVFTPVEEPKIWRHFLEHIFAIPFFPKYYKCQIPFIKFTLENKMENQTFLDLLIHKYIDSFLSKIHKKYNNRYLKFHYNQRNSI